MAIHKDYYDDENKGKKELKREANRKQKKGDTMAALS